MSVHKLRPGDIDIVGAIGDSLTAGNGALATNILQVVIENKGVSWSIGGQGSWHKYLTLPNILKVFNPNLYGYSLSDGYSVQKVARSVHLFFCSYILFVGRVFYMQNCNIFANESIYKKIHLHA